VFRSSPLAEGQKKKGTYGNLEIDKLFGKCAHLVAEAKRVLANLLRRKSKVALALLFALQDDLVLGSLDKVVNIKRAAGLDLDSASVCRVPWRFSRSLSNSTYCKVESNLVVGVLAAGVEARLLVRL